MHCMLMDLLHGFEVLSTTEETLFKSMLFFALFIKITTLFIAKIPSSCNRNLDLGYLVNSSGLFYDDK